MDRVFQIGETNCLNNRPPVTELFSICNEVLRRTLESKISPTRQESDIPLVVIKAHKFSRLGRRPLAVDSLESKP
jgi:hypothetical protein